MGRIYNQIVEVIDKFSPEALSIEHLLDKTLNQLFLLHMLVELLFVACSKAGLTVGEPMRSKQAVVGTGCRQTAGYVYGSKYFYAWIISLPADHAADALAAAVYTPILARTTSLEGKNTAASCPAFVGTLAMVRSVYVYTDVNGVWVRAGYQPQQLPHFPLRQAGGRYLVYNMVVRRFNGTLCFCFARRARASCPCAISG